MKTFQYFLFIFFAVTISGCLSESKKGVLTSDVDSLEIVKNMIVAKEWIQTKGIYTGIRYGPNEQVFDITKRQNISRYNTDGTGLNYNIYLNLPKEPNFADTAFISWNIERLDSSYGVNRIGIHGHYETISFNNRQLIRQLFTDIILRITNDSLILGYPSYPQVRLFYIAKPR